MALTRKMLTALEIPADKQDEIINAHLETLNAVKEERDNFRADAERLADVQRQLDEAKAKIEQAEATETVPKAEYYQLKSEYEEYRNGIEAQQARAAKENAFRQLLKAAGVSEARMDAIIRVSDVDGLELDDNGNAVDAEQRTEAIKTEWADFIPTTVVRGAQTANPPAQNHAAIRSKSDIMGIADPTERQTAWAEYLTQIQKGD